jgi:HEAT repeat protein
MMRERGRVFPALFELLSHSEWPVRLGAMVAAEELAALDLGLAQTLTEQVWKRFDTAGDPARGDLLYLIGELGCEEDIRRMGLSVGGDVSADVREAAEEAIEKIKERIKC